MRQIGKPRMENTEFVRTNPLKRKCGVCGTKVARSWYIIDGSTRCPSCRFLPISMKDQSFDLIDGHTSS